MSATMLPVAILAGGLATRLRPLTDASPKSLIDVNGAPFIAYQLKLLYRQGIERVILCVEHLSEQIVNVVGDGRQFGLDVDYSFDGSMLLGTAGALKQALPLLGESFFVLYGDSYLECDYQAVGKAFERADKLALMTVLRNEGHWDASNVEFVNGRIQAYDKRHPTPQMKYIDYGLGVFRQSAFANIPERLPHDLTSLYRNLLQRDQLAAYEVFQRFHEIGSLSGLDELRQYLRKPH